jgi:hypothetical protein
MNNPFQYSETKHFENNLKIIHIPAENRLNWIKQTLRR